VGARTSSPAFNVADSCITCGAILLAIMLLRQTLTAAADKALR
jgi:lipoprotein signal peptidase